MNEVDYDSFILLEGRTLESGRRHLREKALTEFHRRYATKKLKGSFRNKRRQIVRWLDKQKVEINNREVGENFIISSERLGFLMAVEAYHDEKAGLIRYSFK